MKRTVLIAGVLTLGLSSAAMAEVSVIPRASLGYAAYSLDIPQVGGGAESAAKSTYPVLGVGLTIASDNFYVALDGANSMSAEHDLYSTTGGEFNRNDTAFTIGVTTDAGVQFFGGYKTGKSEFKTPTLANIKKTTFDTSGVFFGLGAGGSSGSSTFSGNFAIAVLDGKLKDDHPTLPYDAKSGSTVGFSLGGSWSTALTDSTRLSLGIKYEMYAYRDWKDPISANNPIPDLNESIASMNIGISTRF